MFHLVYYKKSTVWLKVVFWGLCFLFLTWMMLFVLLDLLAVNVMCADDTGFLYFSKNLSDLTDTAYTELPNVALQFRLNFYPLNKIKLKWKLLRSSKIRWPVFSPPVFSPLVFSPPVFCQPDFSRQFFFR